MAAKSLVTMFADAVKQQDEKLYWRMHELDLNTVYRITGISRRDHGAFISWRLHVQSPIVMGTEGLKPELVVYANTQLCGTLETCMGTSLALEPYEVDGELVITRIMQNRYQGCTAIYSIDFDEASLQHALDAAFVKKSREGKVGTWQAGKHMYIIHLSSSLRYYRSVACLLACVSSSPRTCRTKTKYTRG